MKLAKGACKWSPSTGSWICYRKKVMNGADRNKEVGVLNESGLSENGSTSFATQ
jgi:hypothetical protein